MLNASACDLLTSYMVNELESADNSSAERIMMASTRFTVIVIYLLLRLSICPTPQMHLLHCFVMFLK